MRRQTTPLTPDTAAQVRCALDLLHTALCSDPDLDDLIDAAQDWADDVAHSDAPDDQVAQCAAIAQAAATMFRALGALDAGLVQIVITTPAGGSVQQITFEFAPEGPNSQHFAATVQQAVRTALGVGADA